MRTVVSGSLAGQRPPRDVAGRLETRKSRGEACGLTHGRDMTSTGPVGPVAVPPRNLLSIFFYFQTYNSWLCWNNSLGFQEKDGFCLVIREGLY